MDGLNYQRGCVVEILDVGVKRLPQVHLSAAPPAVFWDPCFSRTRRTGVLSKLASAVEQTRGKKKKKKGSVSVQILMELQLPSRSDCLQSM